MIYFIRQAETNYIKIGYTGGDVRNRMSQLQTSSPHKLILMGYTFGSLFREQMFHKLFDSIRISGEWFLFKISDYQLIYKVINPYRTKLHEFADSKDYKILLNDSCVVCYTQYADDICDECRLELGGYINSSVIDFIEQSKINMIDYNYKSDVGVMSSHDKKRYTNDVIRQQKTTPTPYRRMRRLSVTGNRHKHLSDDDIDDFIKEQILIGLSGNQIAYQISGTRNGIIDKIRRIRSELNA